MRFRIYILLISFLCFSASTALATWASIQNIPDLPNGTHSTTALAVSSDGTVVAGMSNGGGGFQPFLWTQSTGSVAAYSNNYPVFGQFNALSGDGSTIAGFYTISSGNIQAIRWSASNGLQFLSSQYSTANDLSSDGSIVVGSYYPLLNGRLQAFRWTPSTGIQQLSPGPMNLQSEALACSSDGSVIVGRITGPGTSPSPYIWTQSTGMVLLTDNPGTATAVSSHGDVVAGYLGNNLYNTQQTAFRWTPSTGFQTISPLPQTIFSLYPTAMSADGSVVVGQVGLNAQGDGWVWTADQGTRSIRDILQSAGIDMSQWQEINVFDVSADGRTIVADAYTPGFGQAMLITIPEPSAALLTTILILSVIEMNNRVSHSH